MKMNSVNPQKWLNAIGINQGIEVTQRERVLYCSGQTSNAPDGTPLHPGDFVAQFRLASQNVLELVAAANMKPSGIVRMNVYTTDTDAFMTNAGQLSALWTAVSAMPVVTLLGVKSLFHRDILVEIEVTAVA